MLANSQQPTGRLPSPTPARIVDRRPEPARQVVPLSPRDGELSVGSDNVLSGQSQSRRLPTARSGADVSVPTQHALSLDDAAPEPTFRSEVDVGLVKASAGDSDVVWAARVSTAGEKSLAARDEDAAKSAGLIRFLIKNRHGCYDEQTEVLTCQGWKRWPDVDGTESFATLSTDDRITYQRPLQLIVKDFSGPMIGIRMSHVDALVTPDHRMLASRRLQPHRQSYGLVPASDFIAASHRVRMGGGTWEGLGVTVEPARAALLGFFIGDGNAKNGGTPTFRLRKRREIEYLRRNAAAAGFGISFDGRDRYYLLADEDFRLLVKGSYTEADEKCIPADVLHYWGYAALQALLDGLMNSDGSVSETGKETYSTTSRKLADQVQELAVKCGRAAVLRDRPFDSDSAHFGKKPRYELTIYRSRNMEPKVGWTFRDRLEQVTMEPYRGKVYCVTVPNGTLYVRRNGKPMWCGNSPFEHNNMTFLVSAPIFVFREFHRHRVGWSYNESSGRYREFEPVFYVPGRDRRLVQQGKPGSYEFVSGTAEQHALVEEATRDACLQAYARYREMLAAGVAREVARGVLPVCTYSSMYATCNARSLMAFLSLRTHSDASTYPSFPQREIEMVGEQMEAVFARLMPITYGAFVEAGRVAP